MVHRRERGDGGLSFDRNADRWVGRLDLGRGPDSKRIRVKVTGKTRTEAQEEARRLCGSSIAPVSSSPSGP